jgi:uncharacterized protein (TIGR00369 family)
MRDTDLATMKERFRCAPFVADVGLELESLGAGECVTCLDIEPRHLQQNGFVHAGVQATMADHSAGAAAFTCVAAGDSVVTVEFKLSLLRAARGERLVCRSRVLKSGTQFCFAESEVYCVSSGEERLVAKASATLAVVKQQGG